MSPQQNDLHAFEFYLPWMALLVKITKVVYAIICAAYEAQLTDLIDIGLLEKLIVENADVPEVCCHFI